MGHIAAILASGDEAGITRGLARLVVLLVAIGGLESAAQPAPPGQTATDRVVDAHRGVEAATVDVRFATYYSYEDETEFFTTRYRVVIDRPAKRVRVDRPGYTLVCDGADIVVTAEALPGRHLRVPLGEDGLTYERLVEVLPDLANPTAPGLVLLLAGSPMTLLSDGLAEDATPLGVEQALGRRLERLRLPMALGTCTLSAEPGTHLLEEALIEVDPKRLAGGPVQAVRFHYEMDWSGVGEAVDDGLFDLDLKRSQEMTSLAQFLATGPGGGGGAQAGGGNAPGPGGQAGQAGGNAGQTLVGMPLPDMDLAVLGSDDQVNLMDQDEGVVIVEFFATWTKASTLDLPALTAFKTWCEKNDKPVKVYAVAVGETGETMTPWLAALREAAKKPVELAVLLDPETKAAMAMKLPTVPRTIIAVDGRVVDVMGGVKPSFLDDLKEGLPGWLEKVRAKETESAEDGDEQGR